MAELPDRYRQQLEGEPEPSPMWAWLPAEHDAPTATEVIEALKHRFGEGLRCEMTPPSAPPNAAWQLDATLGERRFSVWAAPSVKADTFHIGSPLAERERAELDRSRWSLGVTVTFGEAPLDDYHLQLRALAAIAPSAVAAFDLSAFRVHHFEWVKDSAASAAPPSSSSLFVIHYVSQGEDPGWMHTHGLARCGALELEVFDVPRAASENVSELVKVVASLFLDHGLCPPEEPVEVGQGIELAWLPWAHALSTAAPRFGGGRDDRDSIHGVPSAVLFAPKKKWLGLFGSGLQSLAAHAKAMRGDTVLYISDSQTRRAEILSRERVPMLVALFKRLGANASFKFYVKLGYATDGGESGGKEHLWFEIHGFEGHEHVEATCLNVPNAVAALKEGLRGRHSLGLLSDWKIDSAIGEFDAEHVGLLVHRLETMPDEEAKALGI